MWRIIQPLTRNTICANCLRMAAGTRTNFLPWLTMQVPFRYFSKLSIPTLSVAFINTIDLEQEEEVIPDDLSAPSLSNPIVEACIDSLYSMSEFLNRILEGIADSYLHYKLKLKCLLQLYICLEKYEKFQSNKLMNEEIEDMIIHARSDVRDAEIKYLEIITLSENVKKLAKAMFDLSFLIREENLVIQVGEKLDYIKESIEINDSEIKTLKGRIYKLENCLITNLLTETEKHQESEEDKLIPEGSIDEDNNEHDCDKLNTEPPI